MPLPEEDVRAIYREALGTELDAADPIPNVTRTLARYPDLLIAQRPYQEHLLTKSSIPRRDQELAVLRTGWRCNSEYEFAPHTRISRSFGVNDEDLRRLTLDANDPSWTPFESALIRAVDELYDDNCLSGRTWDELTSRYDATQMIDLLNVIGRYWTVWVILNTFGVEMEEGAVGFPPSAS